MTNAMKSVGKHVEQEAAHELANGELHDLVRALALARNLEGEMKLPRRQFLHLAAGAAALPVVSHIATAQT